MKILETGRLYLRPFEEKDAETIYSYRSLEEVARFQYWEPYTSEQAASFVKQYAVFDFGKREEWIGLAIINKSDKKLIGDCALKINANSAEIGCNISPSFQKQGFAREILSRLLDYCLTLEGIREVYGITDAENIASIRLMKSIGMTRESEFEERAMCKGILSVEHKYNIKRQS